jgi:hypothetical protein
MAMSGVLEEAVEEALGVSSKKWALLLLAFVAGGTAALWMVHRQHGADTSGDTRAAATSAGEEPDERPVDDDCSTSVRGVIRRVGHLVPEGRRMARESMTRRRRTPGSSGEG